jgi:hypothetical protein
MRRRATSGIGVLVLGLALALAPVAASPVSAAKAPKHNVANGACTALIGEQTQSSKLATSLQQAFASGKFATIKQAVVSELTQVDRSVAKARGLLGSAPANVQAAFTTIANVFTHLKTQIQNSTSLTGLEAAFTSLGSSAKLTSASKVLSSYFGSKCGTTTPTT